MFYIPSHHKTLVIEVDDETKRKELVNFLKFKNFKELNSLKGNIISIDIFLKNKSFGYNSIKKLKKELSPKEIEIRKYEDIYIAGYSELGIIEKDKINE